MKITRAQIELSSRCNYKCITCKHGYQDYGEDLSAAICDMLINDVVPNLKTLELQGTGESLLCSKTQDFLGAVFSGTTEVTLITNGLLLDDKIINKIVEAGTQLVISLDGSNEAVYSAHRPVGSFGIVTHNIKRLNEMRNKLNDKGFSLVVNMVLTKLNCNDIPDMICLLSGLGVDYLFVSEIRECMPDVNAWEKLNLLSESSTAEFRDMLDNCKALAKNKGIGFSFNANAKPNGIKKSICESPWNHIFVSANGDVSVCCELGIVFGNLHEQSLDEILSCDKLLKFQKDMLEGKYDSHCVNCCLPWGLPY